MKKALIFALLLGMASFLAVGSAQDKGKDKAKVFKVSGFVGQSTTAAAPNVSVILTRKDTGEMVGTDQTNFFGKYTIKNVPPGIYILQCEKVQRTVAVMDKNVRMDIDLSADSGVMDYTKTGMAQINAKGDGGGPGGSPGPTDAPLMQSFAGEYYHFSGSTEKKIMFCSEGIFFDSSESSYSGTGTDGLGNQNMAWGAAGQKQGSGQWAIQGTSESGTITLVYKSGKRVTVKYEPGPEKGCYRFDGTVFCYSGPARCK